MCFTTRLILLHSIHLLIASYDIVCDTFMDVAYMLQKMDFSAVMSAVFLPCFLFFFLSPAALSHFILFICKVSMTFNCLLGGGVEPF